MQQYYQRKKHGGNLHVLSFKLCRQLDRYYITEGWRCDTNIHYCEV